MLKSLLRWTPGAILVLLGAVAVLSGRTVPSQAPSSSAMDQLLAEVKSLRAELNRAAGSSMRMQLLLARLQLQEQRIVAISGQLTEIRQRLTTVTSGLTARMEQLRRFEEALRSPETPEDHRRDMQDMLADFNVQMALTQKEQQELGLQENTLSAQLSVEQGRWMDFNSRLDELERALPAEDLH